MHQWSSASYLEDQDQWWLPGIFRDVTLLGRPRGALDDVWLRTGYAARRHRHGVPEIVADPAAFPVTVEIPELGVRQEFADPAAVAAFEVGPVTPWSAEVPRLYAAEVRSAGETIRLRLGFRTVRIEGDQFLVNGRKVVFRGMNRHETHPDRGRVFDEAHARADLVLNEAAQRQRHPDQPLSTAPAGAGPGGRARFLGDPGVRPGDPRLRLPRLARQPERRPPVGRRRT